MTALASSVLVVAGLGGAPSASATCASFFGIGNSASCTSSLTTIAIAIGPGATATAEGFFTVAIANGFFNGAGDSTIAQSKGLFTLAYGGGKYTYALAQGNFAAAFVQGENAFAGAGTTSGDVLNVAVNFGRGYDLGFPKALNPFTNPALAGGQGNLAVNLGGRTDDPKKSNGVIAFGLANTAVNIGGVGNLVTAGKNVGPEPSTLGTAFNAFGSGNTVAAGPGPLAVAGSLGQNGATVKKAGPGFNVNGVAVGGASAVRSAAYATPKAAASGRSAVAKSSAGARRGRN